VHGEGTVRLFKKFLDAMIGLLIKLVDREPWGEKLVRNCADLDSESERKFRTQSGASIDESIVDLGRSLQMCPLRCAGVTERL
jgi:hypothetical protein